ncbi:hypothetical protein [Luteipulveratus halotolerans]|uniref:Uncharacterized protein n=1 Tax=Luteipulveratus halotolerans TaxID=1631356 RepID=A0A0L6CJB1_9MICO|nr:hypothetical protein [Luteipulveratus halotolerans]KNX37695.1 hypothetical protein VV01_11955 [Luteipulveratus halotolerans]
MASAVLTACGQESGTGSRPSTTTTPSAPKTLTLAEARAAMTDYDRRNNAAIVRAGAPAYDESAWSAVDTETTLAGDVYGTRVKKAKRAPADSGGAGFSHDVRAVHGGGARSADGQGRWALVDVGTETAEGKTWRSMVAIVPATVAGSWKMSASMSGPAQIPIPKVVAGAVLTAPQRQQLANMVPTVIRSIYVGNDDDLQQNGLITALRRRTNAEETPGDKATHGWSGTTDCRPWGTPKGTDASTAVVVGTPALRVARAQSATLGVLSLDCEVTVQDADGDRKIKLEKAYATAEGDDGSFKERYVRRFVVSLLVSTPDQGKPVVIASSGAYAVPQGR